MSNSYRSLKRFGAPFIILVVGGSFGLQQFTKIRYEFNEPKKFFKEVEREGIKLVPRSEVTLDSQYEKIKTMDLDNWENKRGPRPWEKDNQLYLESVERGEKLKAQRQQQ